MRPQVEMELGGELHTAIREYAREEGVHPRVAYRKLLQAGLEAERGGEDR